MIDFSGKVALIVGGSSGIGAQIAAGLRDGGATVIVADIQPADIKLDVTSLTDWNLAVKFVERTHGRLDLMVNTAGGGIHGLIEDLPEESFDRTLRLNLTGVFLGIKAVFPLMRQSGGGSIVNIASNLALAAMPANGAYCAAKVGVIQLSRVAALEGTKDRIRVNSVLPGITRTPMSEAGLSNPDFNRMVVEPVPMRRAGEPQEIAAAALFLLSDAASYITGTEIAADGGLLASY